MKSSHRSITLRLMIHLSLMFAVLWLVTALVTRHVLLREVEEISSSNLSDVAARLLPLATSVLERKAANIQGAVETEPGDGEENELHELGGSTNELVERFSGVLAFELRDASGLVLLRSRDAQALRFPPDIPEGFHEYEWLITYAISDKARGLTLIVAEPAMHRSEALKEATATLFVPLLLLLPLTALGIWLVARGAVSPVRALQADIARRDKSSLEPIRAGAHARELRQIVGAVNSLMRRLKSALAAERAFASNAAHELRTPLAGALAQTQRLKEEMAEEPARARLDQIEGTLRRLSAYTQKLLQLSRVEGGMAMQGTKQDLRPVLDLVISEFSHRPDAARISVEMAPGCKLTTVMDADAFAIALRNLLENAMAHGSKAEPVRLQVDEKGGLHVINAGPKVGGELLGKLKTRFARGPAAGEGSGLGLAIVDQIMRMAGGRLELYSPALGRDDGFEAVLNLP